MGGADGGSDKSSPGGSMGRATEGIATQAFMVDSGVPAALERPTPRRGAIPSLIENGSVSYRGDMGAPQRSGSMLSARVKVEGPLDLNHGNGVVPKGGELDLNAFGWER